MPIGALMAGIGAAAIAAGGGTGTAPIDFERDVRPIFAAHCLDCHGDADPQGGLRLDQREAAMAGSRAGLLPVIRPGDAVSSVLFERITSSMDTIKILEEKQDDLLIEVIKKLENREEVVL